MASKYIPPHLRGAAAGGAPAALVEPAEPNQSHLDWLRAQQSRYKVVAKTPEELKAEIAAMTFEQLRSRAGPPPNITGGDYGGFFVEDETGENGYIFDTEMRLFKQGRGPPPEPMTGPGREEGIGGAAAMDGDLKAMAEAERSIGGGIRAKYSAWYRAWGNKLTNKWYKEHPRPAPKAKSAKPVKTVTVEEPKGPSRGALVATLDVAEQSGW